MNPFGIPTNDHRPVKDYAVFYGNGPENIEHLSDDFDVPGSLHLKDTTGGKGEWQSLTPKSTQAKGRAPVRVLWR